MPKDQFEEYSDKPAQSKTPITEDGAPEGSSESMHIPAEFLQGTKFKPGDELVLKVVAADDDGVEVEYAKAPEGKGESGGMMSANDELDMMGKADDGGY